MTARPSGPESAAHSITAMRGRIHGIADSIAHGDTVHPDALRLALDALVAAVRKHDAEVAREETLRLAADYLRQKYGVTNRAAGDLLRLAELEAQGRSALFAEETR